LKSDGNSQDLSLCIGFVVLFVDGGGLLVCKLIYSTSASASTSSRLDVATAALKHLIRLIQEQEHNNEENGKEAHGAHRTTINGENVSTSSR
jgi:hypothetical protein